MTEIWANVFFCPKLHYGEYYGIIFFGHWEKYEEEMANFTQKAIKESFIKLLNEKPISKISVKDIVEDCGINRNSFYYHYAENSSKKSILEPKCNYRILYSVAFKA